MSTGKVGSECETSAQCSASIHGPVYCNTTTTTTTTGTGAAVGGRCLCLAGYRPRADQLSCVGRRLSEPCVVDEDCQAAAAADDVSCVGGVCACAAGRVAVSYRTCRLRRHGDLCTVCIAPATFQQQYISYIFTSANEVLFSPVSFCLSVDISIHFMYGTLLSVYRLVSLIFDFMVI